jgi:hypothetical protein
MLTILNTTFTLNFTEELLMSDLCSRLIIEDEVWTELHNVMVLEWKKFNFSFHCYFIRML